MNKIDWKTIFAALALVVTLLTGLAAAVEVVQPKYAIYFLMASGAISAFMKQVEPKVLRRKSGAKKIASLMLIVGFMSGLTACDKTAAAEKTGARVSAQIKTLVKNNGESYDEKLYSKETTLQIVEATDKMITAHEIYLNAVREIKAKYGKTAPPKSEVERLSRLIDAVYRPFLDVLVVFKTLTPEQSALIAAAVESLKLLFDTIKAGLASEIHAREVAETWA